MKDKTIHLPGRPDGRLPNEIRHLRIVPDYAPYAEGSALIEIGLTRVLCTATVQQDLPHWLRSSSPRQGWITAEYSMLPRATPDRNRRERGLTLGGRTQEIQRLIGRSLRAAVDLTGIAEHTIVVDCDVLQADGGTRTASITGGYVALCRALQWMQETERLKQWPVRWAVAAVSVGLVDGETRLDLAYAEDAAAEVDLNVVMNDQDRFVEVQGTAEGEPFAQSRLEAMLRIARLGLSQLFQAQREALGE